MYSKQKILKFVFFYMCNYLPLHRWSFFPPIILFLEWSSFAYCWNILLIQPSSIKARFLFLLTSCLRIKSFCSNNFITMSPVSSFCCWKSNLNSFFLCPKYFFFHLLMFNLCKNAILIWQKCYFTRNVSLFPNQEGPHWKVFILLTIKTNKKK